jgi:hypothetical protein
MRRLLVAIVGPTATGKSALGIALAQRFGGEIVSCDSTAVYRGFDIGTDKVPPSQQGGVPHHMVDVADPTEAYSAARYAREAAAVPDRRAIPRCGAASIASRPAAAPSPSTAGCAVSIRRRPTAFNRAIRSGSCARWRSTA